MRHGFIARGWSRFGFLRAPSNFPSSSARKHHVQRVSDLLSFAEKEKKEKYPSRTTRSPRPGANLSSTIFHARCPAYARAHVDTKTGYIHVYVPGTKHYGCVRAAWVISHARTGPTAPFEYLSETKESIRTEGEKNRKKTHAYDASKNWSRSSRTRLDKPFKRG